MEPIPSTKPVLAVVAIMLVAAPAANAQQPGDSKDTSRKTRTFVPGQIEISDDVASLIYDVDNNVFRCTQKVGLKSGAVLAAMGSEDQTWSVNTLPLSIGNGEVRYPAFADVRTPSRGRRVLLPASVKLHIDIKAGEVLHSNGPLAFDIKTNRSIKADQIVSVLFINGKNNKPSILSVEAAEGGDTQPSFTAFLRDDTPDARRAAIAAWQIEQDHVHQ